MHAMGANFDKIVHGQIIWTEMNQVAICILLFTQKTMRRFGGGTCR